jgi:predicted nucleotidyltransferase
MTTRLLDPHTRRVADGVLAEEQEKRRHVVVALCGAHASGVASPDSDVDLKGIHVASARELAELSEPELTHRRACIIDGVEIDFSSCELGEALRGLAKANGNFLERVLGRQLLVRSELLDELAPLVRASLSTRYYRYYVGFARTQERALVKTALPTVKTVLYVLRTVLTGAHLLRAGELRVDTAENMAEYGFSDALELVERKRAGDQSVLDYETVDQWRVRLAQAFDVLERAHVTSSLPDEAPNLAELESWLSDVRLREGTRSPVAGPPRAVVAS